jgi:hypothetical protein
MLAFLIIAPFKMVFYHLPDPSDGLGKYLGIGGGIFILGYLALGAFVCGVIIPFILYLASLCILLPYIVCDLNQLHSWYDAVAVSYRLCNAHFYGVIRILLTISLILFFMVSIMIDTERFISSNYYVQYVVISRLIYVLLATVSYIMIGCLYYAMKLNDDSNSP